MSGYLVDSCQFYVVSKHTSCLGMFACLSSVPWCYWSNAHLLKCFLRHVGQLVFSFKCTLLLTKYLLALWAHCLLMLYSVNCIYCTYTTACC